MADQFAEFVVESNADPFDEFAVDEQRTKQDAFSDFAVDGFSQYATGEIERPRLSSTIGEQIAEIPSALKVGVGDSFYGAIAGAHRSGEQIARKLEAKNRREYDKVIANGGDKEGWRAQAFDTLAGFHSKAAEWWGGDRGVKEVDVARQAFLEKNELLTNGYITDIARGVGGMADVIPWVASAGLTGLLTIPSRMFDEGYQDSSSNPENTNQESLDLATAYALIATPIDALSNLLIFKGGGRATTKLLMPIVMQALKKSGMNFLAEGTTETLQDAVLNKLNGRPAFSSESIRTFIVSGFVGTIAGSLTQTTDTIKIQRAVTNMENIGLSNKDAVKVVNLMQAGKVEEAQQFISERKPSLRDIIEEGMSSDAENNPLTEKEEKRVDALVKKGTLVEGEQAELNTISLKLDPSDQERIDAERIANMEAQNATERTEEAKPKQRAAETETGKADAEGETAGGVRPDTAQDQVKPSWNVDAVDSVQYGDAADDYYYHVTTKDGAMRIIKDGLVPGEGTPSMAEGVYRQYSKGKSFLSERGTARFWADRIEEHLDHQYDDPPSLVIVKIPKADVSNVKVDEFGERDSGGKSYYVDKPIASPIKSAEASLKEEAPKGEPKVVSKEKVSQDLRETPLQQLKPQGKTKSTKPDTKNERIVGVSRKWRDALADIQERDRIPLPERQAQIDVMNKAKDSDIDGATLIDELFNSPRPVSTIEVAIILRHKTKVLDQYDSLRAQEAVANEAQLQDILNRKNAILSYLSRLDRASSLAITESARGLAAVNMKLGAETYDLVSILDKATTRAKRPVTPQEAIKIEADFDSFDAQRDKLAKLAGEENGDIADPKSAKDLSEKLSEYLSYLENVHREIKETAEAKPKSEQQIDFDKLKKVVKQQDAVIDFINILNGRDTKKAAIKKDVFDPEGYVATLKNLKKQLADESRAQAKTNAEKLAKETRIQKIEDDIVDITGEIENAYRIVPKKKVKTPLTAREIKKSKLLAIRSQQDRVFELLEILRTKKIPEQKAKKVVEDIEGYVATAQNLQKQIRNSPEFKEYLRKRPKKAVDLTAKIQETKENSEQAKRTIRDPKKPKSQQEMELAKWKEVERDQDMVFSWIEKINKKIIDASKLKVGGDPEGLKAIVKNLKKEYYDSEWYKDAKKDPTKAKRKRMKMLENTLRHMDEQLVGKFRDVKKNKVIEDSDITMLKDEIKFIRDEMRIEDELAVINEDLRLISKGRLSEVSRLNRRKKQSKLSDRLVKEQAELNRKRNILDRRVWELERSGASKVAMDIADFVRAVKLSLDSWIGRQGAKALFSSPKEGVGAFIESVPGYLNESWFYEADRRMNALPSTKHGKEHNLQIMEIDGTFDMHQEAINSPLAERFPFVRASNRHMILGINLLRAKLYKKFYNRFPNESDAFYDGLAEFINVWTGRGSLGSMEKAAHGLSAIFTAPRWTTSNWQAIVAERSAWIKDPKTGKKELNQKLLKTIMAEKAKASLGFGMIASMMIAMGFELEKDPEEGDFMKLRKGNLVIDLMPGLSSNLRLLGLMTESITARAGIGELEGRNSFTDIADRYLAYKYAPIISAGREMITGETAVGQEREARETLVLSALPIMLDSIYQDYYKDGEDMIDVLRAQGIQWFGFGTQLYED